MALYNKMRPRSFADMVGQESAVQILKGIIKTERIPNALLFIGTRGTGKTTAARAFGKYLNCLSPTEDGPCLTCENCKAVAAGTMDIVELDAASHTGVDDIRKLIESTQYAPTLKRKVYIIDEVHMLSTAAFNALLKTLEEPPHGCFFILCTTEAHKVPVTIKSRCMGIDFTRIDETVIYGQLVKYCESEGVSFEEDALKIIARAADGGMRDAWTIFERFLAEDAITVETVLGSLGMMAEDSLFCLLAGIARGDAPVALDALKDLTCRGKSAEILVKDIIGILTDVIYLHQTKETKSLLNTESYKEGIEVLAQDVDSQKALSYIKELTDVYHGSKTSDMNFAVEAAVMSIIARAEQDNLLEQRIDALEKEVKALKERQTVVCTQTTPAAAVVTKETSYSGVKDIPAFTVDAFDELPLSEVPEEESLSESPVIRVGSKTNLDKIADSDMDGFEPIPENEECMDGFEPVSPLELDGYEMIESDTDMPEGANELGGEIGETISLSLDDEEEEQEQVQEEEEKQVSDGLDAFLFGGMFDFPRQN